MNYEKSILFYFDILGFKNIISNTVTTENIEIESETSRILEALTNIENYFLANSENSKTIAFSDTIIISIPFTKVFELESLVSLTCNIQEYYFKWGFLIRGSITSGLLYHSKNKIFGPALISAYLDEKNKAIYPRIIVSKEIYSLLYKEPLVPEWESERYPDYLELDDDGEYYLNYFSYDPKELEKYLLLFPFDSEDSSIMKKLLWVKTKLFKNIKNGS